MNSVNDIMYYPNLNESVKTGLGRLSDPDKAAKQVEQVFLGELLKNMFENTEFGKAKMVSDYLPYITSEIAKSLSERGIGIHDFLMKNPSFSEMVSDKVSSKDKDNPAAVEGEDVGKLKVPAGGRISAGYGAMMK